jgi:hypothetical protein
MVELDAREGLTESPRRFAGSEMGTTGPLGLAMNAPSVLFDGTVPG